MNDSGAAAASETRVRRRIWRLVLLAALIAAAIAGAIAALSGDEIVSAADYRAKGSDYAAAMEAGFAFAVPAATTLIVWLAFTILAFNRRARFWKSLVALLAMAPIALLVAAPIRIVSFTSAVSLDDAQVEQWRNRYRPRMRALRADLANSDGTLRDNDGLQGLQRRGDLPARLADVRHARAQYRQYQTSLEALLAEARTELMTFDIYEGARERGVAWMERTYSDNVRRHFALTDERYAKLEEIDLFLLAHPQMWDVREGRMILYIGPDAARFEALEAEMAAMQTNLDRLEGAMGVGADADALQDDALEDGNAASTPP